MTLRHEEEHSSGRQGGARRHAEVTTANGNPAEPAESSSSEEEEATTRDTQTIMPFTLLPPDVIYTRIHALATQYPEFVTLTNAQETYGLPAAGTANDCPYDRDPESSSGCRNWILTIEDRTAHSHNNGGEALPEVLLSGCLHGNERVGPTAVVETASLLLEAAQCESIPRVHVSVASAVAPVGAGGEQQQPSEDELSRAEDCRATLASRGITPAHRQWLARLVSTRRIVVVPTANALGYYRDKREEGNIDPNRDFPYDLEDPTICMRTIAGRTFNELFRDHLFQLSFTFHGGMEAVAYEWGAPTYLNHDSPDDEAQKQIASGYSRYGGGWTGTQPYQHGTMNDVVYYVRGGMEDWAYAGSWDPERVVQCQPSEFGGYDAAKTRYDNSTLRAFNMLVETSNQKTPSPNTLGTTEKLFDGSDVAGNGHVSRNIRLSLLAIDLVEPYVSIYAVSDVTLTESDLLPGVPRAGRQAAASHAVSVPTGTGEVTIRWTVGGAFNVDYTSVLFAKWTDVPEAVDGTRNDYKQDELGLAFQYVPAVKGRTRWHPDGASPSGRERRDNKRRNLGEEGDDDGAAWGGGPAFSSTIDLTSYQTGDRIAVLAVANVDKSWSTKPSDPKPAVGPQSHVVNARTNPDWYHEKTLADGKTRRVVKGRLDWYSVPLTIVVGGPADANVANPQEGQLSTPSESGVVQLFDRLKGSSSVATIPVGGGGGGGHDSPSTSHTPNSAAANAVGALVGIIAAVIACALLVRWRRRRAYYGRERVTFDADATRGLEDYESDGIYSDDDEEDGGAKNGVRRRSPSNSDNEGEDIELPKYTID